MSLYTTHVVFTYRYFLHRFPHLCILAVPDTGDPNEEPIGCVVGKIDEEDGDSHDTRHQDEEEVAFIEEEAEEEQDEEASVSSSGIGNVDTNNGDHDEIRPRRRASDESVVSEHTTGYIGKSHAYVCLKTKKNDSSSLLTLSVSPSFHSM
jgi:hypothetical protein